MSFKQSMNVEQAYSMKKKHTICTYRELSGGLRLHRAHKSYRGPIPQLKDSNANTQIGNH